MEEHCVVANVCFTDEFDLPLTEGIADDYYTADEIRQEVVKRIKKINTLSTEYKLSADSVIKYELIDRNGNIAELEPVDAYKYIFRISKLAARKRNEKYLDTIIYHELCHAMQINFLLSTNTISIENGELTYDRRDKELVNSFCFANEGHTRLWYSFARSVNAAFVINPPVDRFMTDKDVSDLFLEGTFSRESVRINNLKFTDNFDHLFTEEK